MPPVPRVQGVFLLEVQMRFVTLTQDFYTKYSGCKEILSKESRPYAMLQFEVDGIKFGIPIRHHISHPFAFLTIGDRGLDFTKAIVIEKEEYISNSNAIIDTAEWKIISRNESKSIRNNECNVRR